MRKLVFDMTDSEYKAFRLKAMAAGMTSAEYFRGMRPPVPRRLDNADWCNQELYKRVERIAESVDEFLFSMDMLTKSDPRFLRDAFAGFLNDLNNVVTTINNEAEKIASSIEQVIQNEFRGLGGYRVKQRLASWHRNA